MMNVAGTMQSGTYLDDDTYCDLAFSYTRDYDCMFLAGVPVRDVLVLGGGGYSYPKHLIAHRPETFVTCVEIDPVVTAIARRYFFLDRLFEEYDLDEAGRLQLVEGDAREFLEQSDERYDAIVNDCFAGMSLVESLATREAAQLYHEHLREGGVYLSNVIGAVEGPRSRAMRRILRTLASESSRTSTCCRGNPRRFPTAITTSSSPPMVTGASRARSSSRHGSSRARRVLLDATATDEDWTVPTA